MRLIDVYKRQGYIYYDIAINKEYDRINKQIHEEAAICIQSIRDKYTECDNIPTAVLNSDTGKLLSLIHI